MPAYHRYLGYRLDARGVDPVESKDRARDLLSELHKTSFGGHRWLENHLAEIDLVSDAHVDVLVETPDYFSFALWTLHEGKIDIQSLSWATPEGERIEIEDGLVCPSVAVDAETAAALASVLRAHDMDEDELEHDDGRVTLPANWSSRAALDCALEILAPRPEPLRLVATAPGEVFYAIVEGEARVARLELAHDDLATTALVRRLYTGEDEELGMEDADALATPDERSPLTAGHLKGRLAALAEIAARRDAADVPMLLEALASPSNAGAEFVPIRQAIFRAITWHDRPDVRAAVSSALEREAPAVIETVKYVAWRLPQRGTQTS